MRTEDMQPFFDVPFNFWFKDAEGRYLWVSRVVNEMAGEDVVGKTDRDLIWKDSAEPLIAVDNEVLTSGKTRFLQESADLPDGSRITLNCCKFAGELDGKKGTFGVSFGFDS